MPIRKLAVRRGGIESGAPALFLHAALGLARMWVPVWDNLKPYHLIAPNLPGHGGTGYNDWQDLQYQAMEDALSCVPRGAPVHLVGHSFGATVALRMALEQPGQIRSLTLIEPVCFNFLHDAEDPMYVRHLKEMTPLAKAFEAGDMKAAAAFFLKAWNGEDLAAMTAETQKQMVDMMPLIRASEASIVKTETKGRVTLADVAGLKPPTLLMLGSETRPVMRRIHRRILEALPDASATKVGDAGHMVPLHQPKRVAQRIKAFWKKEGARG